jgi:DNA mismatch repair ATPase MutS
MRRWLDAWSEFEALNALATYAFEHPENVYPEILAPSLGQDSAPAFVATALNHPLLPKATAVANDIRLDSNSRFYVISGSNMAGKSTLLRAIGVNAVLAFAGAPIPAESAHISPLRLCSSLALTDSLAEGKSKFFAEADRIRAILAVAAEAPTLFLIDEIFSGTNSLDRLAASDAILRALIGRGAIGALSTHDLALTAIADDPGLHGLNLHMASPSNEDPLAFDYRLRPGINTASSARAILRLLEIES